MKTKNLSLERRWGTFFIDGAFIDKEPEAALVVMLHFLVTNATHDYCRGGIQYTALSAMFDVLPEGFKAPEYEITITRLDDEVVRVDAERIN